jgi:hypothetical protein
VVHNNGPKRVKTYTSPYPPRRHRKQQPDVSPSQYAGQNAKGNITRVYLSPPNELRGNLLTSLTSTRGQGRSPYANFTAFHYDDFTLDAIALLDHLHIQRVAVLGWSDGAITGLDLAMNYSSRIDRVFAHGANPQANMSIPGTNDPIIKSKSGSLDSDFSTNGTTFSTNPSRLRRRNDCNPYTCESLSPLPSRCAAMMEGVNK